MTSAATQSEHCHDIWAAWAVWVKVISYLSKDLMGSCKVALLCKHSSNAIDSIQIACTALARSAHVGRTHLDAFLDQTTSPKKAWTVASGACRTGSQQQCPAAVGLVYRPSSAEQEVPHSVVTPRFDISQAHFKGHDCSSKSSRCRLAAFRWLDSPIHLPA